jgi:hypothetical protein
MVRLPPFLYRCEQRSRSTDRQNSFPAPPDEVCINLCFTILFWFVGKCARSRTRARLTHLHPTPLLPDPSLAAQLEPITEGMRGTRDALDTLRLPSQFR